MRALRCTAGVIPRAFANHRTPEGHAYRAYLGAILGRLGPLPPSARPWLREAGVLSVELFRLGQALEAALSRHRQREASRYRRQAFAAREQLARIEDRLAELAAQRPRPSLASILGGKAGA
jgi:hypothetical protein